MRPWWHFRGLFAKFAVSATFISDCLLEPAEYHLNSFCKSENRSKSYWGHGRRQSIAGDVAGKFGRKLTEANRIRRSSTARHLQCPNPSFDTKEYIVSDCGITEQLLLTVELLCTRGFREVQMSSPTNHKQRHPKKSAFSCEPCRKRKVCSLNSIWMLRANDLVSFKVKCDAGHPVCDRCKSREDNCVYKLYGILYSLFVHTTT